MTRLLLTRIALTAIVVTSFLTTESEAQLFNQNNRFRGGIPAVDMVPQQRTPRNFIRNNRILGNRALQFVPQSHIPRGGNFRQQNFPPERPSPFAAGQTVGGRFRIAERPRPQSAQPQSGWQPWMHVPLDGSQPWNK